MFWYPEKDTHILYIAQHADTILEQTVQVQEPARGAPYRMRNERGCQTDFVATVLNQGSRTQKDFLRSPLIRHEEPSRTISTSTEGIYSNALHHCGVCLAKDHKREQCTYTASSKELAKLRETSFHMRFGSHHNSRLHREALIRSRIWNSSQHPSSQPRAPAYIEEVMQKT